MRERSKTGNTLIQSTLDTTWSLQTQKMINSRKNFIKKTMFV